MGLTSTKLEVLTAVLAVVCFGGTLWLWPRLGRRSLLALSGRFGLLAAGQALTLAAILLAANNWGGFYSSWSDLTGSDGGGQATLTEHPTAPVDGIGDAVHRSGDVVPAGPARTVPLGIPGARASGGTVQQVRITGGRTGLVQSAYVYLPPEYGEAAYAHTRFPVVVVLTGYPGTAKNLITRMKYPTLVAQDDYRHTMKPTVLVLMRPSVAMPRDTECQDVPHGPQALSFFTRDLPQALAGHYRVGSGPHYWGVIGDSTGGYCALSFAMRDPHAYGAAVALSGYYKPDHDDTTGDLFGGSKARADQADLMWRLRHLPAPDVSLLVTSSPPETDWKTTNAFVAAVRAPARITTLYLRSGGHNFATWNRETPQSLIWLGQHLT